MDEGDVVAGEPFVRLGAEPFERHHLPAA